jgi:hypothetical protein
MPASHQSATQCTHIQRLKRGTTSFQNLKMNVIKCLRRVSHESRAFVQAIDRIDFNARSAEI